MQESAIESLEQARWLALQLIKGLIQCIISLLGHPSRLAVVGFGRTNAYALGEAALRLEIKLRLILFLQELVSLHLVWAQTGALRLGILQLAVLVKTVI